jgi:tetratricopeptide (TPR) repeat protein
MPEPKIHSLPEREALEQIVETVQQVDEGEAPFALVLGSGFSQGLVPTAREVVSESLPLWVKSRRDGSSFESLKEAKPAERTTIAREFWRRFVERNAARGLALPLDSRTGLPEDYAGAYKAAFAPNYNGAVGEPAQARKFQRALMRLDQPRLNAAHFLLASLIGVQPGKSRKSRLFKARGGFCRLILTTNFDPFLQTALQAVNRLYFMSDTPELGVSDDIFDDPTDAIHLVYLHGSIHRRSQAATEEDIQALKAKNAQMLAPVLKRHGVIVLGYSGWDDAVVEALAACDRFDHRLYWCGLERDPRTRGAFGPRVADILGKPAALYVQTTGAGRFMAQLCKELVDGLPRLLSNPIGQLRELLDTIDLKELENFSPSVPVGSNMPQLPDSEANAETFVRAKQSMLQSLELAERVFFGQAVGVTAGEKPMPTPTKPEPVGREERGVTAGPSVDSQSKARQLISSASLAGRLGNYAEVLKICNEAITLPGLEASTKVEIWRIRALAHHFAGRTDDAVGDYSQIIELPGAPVEYAAKALISRGIAWSQQGDTEKEIADYTRVIEQLREAPVQQVALALVYRGLAWSQKGDTEKEIADYTRVIEQLPDVTVDHLAQALVNRGVAWGRKGDTEKEIADYTRVIEQLPDVTVGYLAQALVNRGVAWGRKGDTEKEITDYTRVIEQLPDVTVDHLAQALVNRGLAWSQKGDTEKEIADYTRVIEELPDVTVDRLVLALVNRGIAWGRKGDTEKEIADYTRVIEQLPDVTVDRLALALVNRGIAWGRKGDTEKEIADYTRLIEQLQQAPVQQVAGALVYRGLTWGQKGDTDKEIADYTRVIEQLPDAPVEQVAKALVNRGIAWGRKGDADKAIADYTCVIERWQDVTVDRLALALVNRGIAWGRKGDTENEIADYTRVIEQLPDAPVEQVARALVNRGIAWGRKGDTENEIADYTRVIEQLQDAPVEPVALALVTRGVAWGRKGDLEKTLADCTRVIEQLQDAPVQQVALALVYRGVAWGQKGETDKAIADYTQVIEHLPNAPVDQVAQALTNRGWAYYTRGNYPAFLADTDSALSKQPASDVAAFNLGLAFLACGRDADALAAYRRAGEQFPEKIETYALADLAEAQKTWLTEERARPVTQLLLSLKK